MKMPKQVQTQIDEANRMLTPQPAEPAPPSADAAPAEPAVVENPTPAAPAEPEVVPKDAYLRLEQQLRSLQGIHKSIDRDRADLRATVADLTAKVDDLTKQLAEKQTPPVQQSLLTPEEITEYTPELLSVIERKAQEVIGPAIAAEQKRSEQLTAQVSKLAERNKQLEQLLSSVSETATEVNVDKFVATIASLMPDWEAVNNDPSFMEWLGTQNTLTGREYAVDFYAARDRYDARAIVEFFRTYKSLTKKAKNAPSLEAQVTPRSGGGPDAAPPPQGKIWTQQAIAKFFRDKAQGKYPAQQAAALEADIFKAQAENRLVA